MVETAKLKNEISLDYEDELAKFLTKKTIDEVLNVYSLKELNHLSALMLFIKFV
ncbi:MAG TPA: hypothetical protein VF868_00475 [Bacteroidia bacterium]|jgi:hypothetical protein